MSQELYDREFETMPEKDFTARPAYFEVIPTSQLAIASLVFGILAYVILPLVGAIVAIVTGHMALAQIRGAGGRVEGRAMARSGLILGYLQVVLVAIGAVIVAGLLVLGLKFAREMETTKTVVEIPATPPAAVAPVVAGVKMVNEMDKADFRLIADAGVDAKPAEIVAFYNAGEPASNPEFAAVTTKAVVYVKDGSKTVFDLADVLDVKADAAFEKLYHARQNQFGEGSSTVPDPSVYHIELVSKGGSRMRIKIKPELDGVSFFEALKSAKDAAGEKTGK